MSNRKNEILFLKPVMKEAIWGGKRLEEFGYQTSSDHTGEAWVISAHPNGDCIITGGEYDGMTLSSLFESKRELFGGIEGDRFPLLIKIIDANQDLSIQVHPDDAYAAEHENGSLGKTECWYILDCNKDATIVIGHNAKNKEEMRQMIEEGRWVEFIREIPIKKGDFFQINPGCLHTIKAGTMLLETQQNCDITYRIYDYDRLYNGEKRELHLQKGIDVIEVPFKPHPINRIIEKGEDYSLETLIECKYYKVCKLDVNGVIHLTQDSPFVNVNIIDGFGKINETLIKKGDNFIIPSDFGEYEFRGNLGIILSTICNS